MTLDCLEVSLSRVFASTRSTNQVGRLRRQAHWRVAVTPAVHLPWPCSGQAYVALSRARSAHGLRVLDFDRNKIRAHDAVRRFYQVGAIAVVRLDG